MCTRVCLCGHIVVNSMLFNVGSRGLLHIISYRSSVLFTWYVLYCTVRPNVFKPSVIGSIKLLARCLVIYADQRLLWLVRCMLSFVYV